MSKTDTPAAAPVETPVVEAPAETAPVAAKDEPVILNKDTVIETNRQPFSGTKVETNSTLQVSTQEAATYDTVDLGNGTVLTTYTGVQPGVVLTNAAPDAE